MEEIEILNTIHIRQLLKLWPRYSVHRYVATCTGQEAYDHHMGRKGREKEGREEEGGREGEGGRRKEGGGREEEGGRREGGGRREEEGQEGEKGRGVPDLAGQDEQDVGLNAGQLENTDQLDVGRKYPFLLLSVSLPLFPLERPHQGGHHHKHHTPEQKESREVHYPALLRFPAQIGVAEVLGLERQEYGVP